MNYDKLVKALRCCTQNPPKTCVGCTYNIGNNECAVRGMMCDAADAIEALYHQTDILANAIKLLTEGRERLLSQLPKRGEWVDRYDEDDKPFFKRKYVCSACGHWNTYGKSNYCPKCGAKMEVPDGDEKGT